MEAQSVEGHSEHVKKTPEATYPEEKPRDFSSASSVSTSSASSRSSSSSSTLDFDPAEKDGDLSPFTTHAPQWSMLTASPPPEILMQSPPVQTMGQYDPNRIPSSIFSTKVTNASDWSVASNESLFSIHMGNNSFSRDSSIKFGKYSGELPRLSESSPSTLPTVIEAPAHHELEKEDYHHGNSLKVANVESHAEEKTSPAEVVRLTSSSTPRLSDDSGKSSSSFAFPVLVNDSGKGGSISGVTEKVEKAEVQEEVPKEEMAAEDSKTRWCSWFTCMPRCC